MDGCFPAGKVVLEPSACRPQQGAPAEVPMLPPSSSARAPPPADSNVVPPFRHTQSFCMEVAT